MTRPQTNDIESAPNPEVLRGLLQHVPLGANQTIIVTNGPQVLAHRGILKEVEAGDVAIFIDNEWREAGQTLRIQFMPVPLSSSFHLILVYPLRDSYRLILVDDEEAPLESLRKLSVQLLGILEVAGIGRKPL